MKKEYGKPMIVFENFQISANIASCVFKGNHSNENSCGYSEEDGGLTVFTSQLSKCDFPADFENDTFCYHNPEPSISVFGS